MEDVALLEAWRSGDREAGDALLARHMDAVHRFFRTKVGDGVEDLVQQTFLGCVESKGRVAPDNFRAYLFGIARHRLMDHLRYRMGKGAKLDTLNQSIAELKTSPSSLIAKSEEQKLLIRAMQCLPVDFQVALELAYWEDMSGREIAEVLEINENTVRSRLARGRQQLREHIERLAESTELAESTVQVFEKP